MRCSRQFARYFRTWVQSDWHLFKCINHEVQEGNRTYVLNTWHENTSDFATAVGDACRAVRLSETILPEYEDLTKPTTT